MPEAGGEVVCRLRARGTARRLQGHTWPTLTRGPLAIIRAGYLVGSAMRLLELAGLLPLHRRDAVMICSCERVVHESGALPSPSAPVCHSPFLGFAGSVMCPTCQAQGRCAYGCRRMPRALILASIGQSCLLHAWPSQSSCLRCCSCGRLPPVGCGAFGRLCLRGPPSPQGLGHCERRCVAGAFVVDRDAPLH